MTLRRLPVALPLAVLVAVFAHVAGVGFDHAPGGAGAGTLAVGLAVALVLVGLGAFFAGALRPGSSSIATSGRDGYPPWLLAGVGFAVYVAIELIEGHLAFGGALRALLAVVPAALGVRLASRCFDRFARHAGARFAGYARSRSIRVSSLRLRRAANDRPRSALVCVGKRRGRAPPLLA